jgi:hypothetical protein
MGYRIECPENVEALPPRSGIDKKSLKAPQKAEKRLEHKMRSINEVHVPDALFGIRQDWI